MPLTSEQLSIAGKMALDLRLKNMTDLHNTDRPLIKFLRSKQKPVPGAVQYIEEQLRTTNDGNFQWYGPDDQVTYNRRDTRAKAQFTLGFAHDGFALTDQELTANYITITEDQSSAVTNSEMQQIANLIDDNSDVLREGFMEALDYALWLDGTQDANAIPGIDALISTTPATGIVGGINRATAGNEYWRNQVELNVAATSGTLTEAMERMFRNCSRIGNMTPDHIEMGSKALDAYRKDAKSEIQRHIIVPDKGGQALDPGTTGLHFRGVPIIWNPIFDTLQANLAASAGYEWDKRIYFFNSRTLKLRPVKGQDMVVRKPPRAYDRYTHYWGLTWAGGLTITNPSANGVMTID